MGNALYSFLVTKGDNKLENNADRVFENNINISGADNKNDIFIIGAGFGRTGTSSLQLALSELGIRCYHMRETWKKENVADTDKFLALGKIKYDLKHKLDVNSFFDWDKVSLVKNDHRVDWNKQIFKKTKHNEYGACVDYPAVLFYLDLLEYYSPNYKVILTIRDSPKKWYDSTRNTIYRIQKALQSGWLFNLCTSKNRLYDKYLLFGIFFDDKFVDEEYAINKYVEWNHSVEQHVPKDKLLIFNVKEGWEPLCRFLNKEIPKTKFPHSNEGKLMQDMTKQVKIVNMVLDTLAVFAMVGVGYVMYKKLKK